MPVTLDEEGTEAGEAVSSTIGSDELRDLRERRRQWLGAALALVIAALSIGIVGLAAAYHRQGLKLRQAILQKDEMVEPQGPYGKGSASIPPVSRLSCPNYSPTFPSLGGPDCTFPCSNGTRSVGTAFFNPFPASYAEKVIEAGKLVKSIDSGNTVYTEGSGPNAFMDSHISFSYYCCYPEDQLSELRKVLAAWDGWRPRSVSLSHVTCAIDGPALDHVSFIIMLDQESNRRMQAWVAELEAHIRAAGLPIHLPRSYQEPYHTTLAVVNGTTYPVAKAVRALNARFRPGSWFAEPINLTRPCNAHGSTPEGFFC
mmetsp:Transcript_15198/g.34480  ORF Transcript_15198/g.34480 Transcript_15198/m.34480 type:complete len:314 (-) Transcript_15198:15-956(-)